MPDAPFEADSDISRRRRGLVYVGFAVLAASLVTVTAAFAFRIRPPSIAVFLFSLGVPTVLLLLRRSWRRPTPTLSRVRVDGRGVFADGQLVVSRDAIRGGHFRPRGSLPPLVRLQLRHAFESVDVDVRDEDEGTRLLRALALDASRSVAEFRTTLGLFDFVQGILAAVVGLGGLFNEMFGPGFYLIPVFAACAALVFLNAWPSTISVGTDGVRIASLFRRRFYPFASVVSVEPSKWGFDLVMRDGKRVTIHTRGGAVPNQRKVDDEAPAIIARIRAALAAYSASPVADAVALVARDARPYDAWVSALRALGRDEEYRVATLPREGLWQVLESPAAQTSARAGAAMALRATLDDEGRHRLRVASAATASPRVRVAFDVIARVESDDAALREALEACDEEVAGEDKHA